MAEETASQMAVRLYRELGYQPDEITRRLLTELRVPKPAQRVLYTWIRDRVQHVVSRLGRDDGEHSSVRAADRARQHREGATTKHSQRSQERYDSQDGVDPRLRFLDAQVPCPGAAPYPGETIGGWKYYRDFTVEDHEARISIHRPNRDGAQRAMDGHAWAIKTIHRHKVATLDAIATTVIAAELPKEGVRA